MITGKGFGKVILFGEHFVVHGNHAIVAGISNHTTVEIEPSEKDEIITKFPIIPELASKATNAVKDAMNIKENFKIHMKGNLPIRGGLGSSAAYCVALARAFSEFYSKNLSNEQVNEISYEGEKVFHGTPSGVDNTAATYGGALLYKKGEEQFKKINLGKTLNLVVGLTGKMGHTKKLVASVKELKEKNPEKINPVFEDAEKLVQNAVIGLEKGNLENIGKLMDQNQELLRKIKVSAKENEELVSLFLSSGALGAKLTGGGGGGSCIALAKDENNAQEILEKIKKENFEGFTTSIF